MTRDLPRYDARAKCVRHFVRTDIISLFENYLSNMDFMAGLCARPVMPVIMTGEIEK